MTKPKAHRCKDCDGKLIPIDIWDDHVALHKNQLDMFPDKPRQEPEPKRRGSRKRQEQGIA